MALIWQSCGASIFCIKVSRKLRSIFHHCIFQKLCNGKEQTGNMISKYKFNQKYWSLCVFPPIHFCGDYLPLTASVLKIDGFYGWRETTKCHTFRLLLHRVKNSWTALRYSTGWWRKWRICGESTKFFSMTSTASLLLLLCSIRRFNGWWGINLSAVLYKNSWWHIRGSLSIPRVNDLLLSLINCNFRSFNIGLILSSSVMARLLAWNFCCSSILQDIIASARPSSIFVPPCASWNNPGHESKITPPNLRCSLL